MQIEKAIELLEFEDHATLNPRGNNLWDAIRLGTEALKAIRAWRRDWEGNRFHLLPGEHIELPNPHSTANFDSQNR